MVTFLRLWDRIVYGRDHRAKWAALAAIKAVNAVAPFPWTDVPRYEDFDRWKLEIEERWMRCPHEHGFRKTNDSFVMHIEVCPDCMMPRWDGEQREGIYTFVRLQRATGVSDDSATYIVVNVPVRAEGRQRVRGPAVVQ